MGRAANPLWLVGFRPFFTLAILAGVLFPPIWALVFSGYLHLPQAGLSPLQWHAHEMIFGFGWAVLGGFLLTASKNWVKIRGMHGIPLAIAAGLWIVERVLIPFAPWASMNLPARFLLGNVFLFYVAGYIVWSLVKYRENDTFKDNYFFLIGLPLFLLAKVLIFSPETFNAGYLLAIGLFRLAFAVMFERTVTQFMKNSLQIDILRHPVLDTAIKASVLLAAFEGFLPVFAAVTVLFLAASLLLFRFCFWRPFAALKRFEIGVMYVGYFALTLHLFLEALRLSGALLPSAVGTLSLHVFTFLCMGIVIPAMLIRISQGHTGRKLLFTGSDRAAFWSMGVAAFFRLVATQVWPAQYLVWVGLAAAGWSLCFAVIGFRILPFLWQARVDGREH